MNPNEKAARCATRATISAGRVNSANFARTSRRVGYRRLTADLGISLASTTAIRRRLFQRARLLRSNNSPVDAENVSPRRGTRETSSCVPCDCIFMHRVPPVAIYRFGRESSIRMEIVRFREKRAEKPNLYLVEFQTVFLSNFILRRSDRESSSVASFIVTFQQTHTNVSLYLRDVFFFSFVKIGSGEARVVNLLSGTHRIYMFLLHSLGLKLLIRCHSSAPATPSDLT